MVIGTGWMVRNVIGVYRYSILDFPELLSFEECYFRRKTINYDIFGG